MISPQEVLNAASKKKNENYKFRRFLKNHADEKELDEQFLRLHHEIYNNYDCSKCRNCCKLFHAEIPITEIERDAQYLGMNTENFIKTYLQKDEYGIEYITNNTPCDFFVDNQCLLGDCKPKSCANFPHTNQPERLLSLLSFIENVSVCPIAYEIFERLKQEYNFK